MNSDVSIVKKKSNFESESGRSKNLDTIIDCLKLQSTFELETLKMSNIGKREAEAITLLKDNNNIVSSRQRLCSGNYE